jgi:hypothetical protein
MSRAWGCTALRGASPRRVRKLVGMRKVPSGVSLTPACCPGRAQEHWSADAASPVPAAFAGAPGRVIRPQCSYLRAVVTTHCGQAAGIHAAIPALAAQSVQTQARRASRKRMSVTCSPPLLFPPRRRRKVLAWPPPPMSARYLCADRKTVI